MIGDSRMYPKQKAALTNYFSSRKLFKKHLAVIDVEVARTGKF